MLTGANALTDGTLTASRFDAPYGLYLDDSGNIIVVDCHNAIIRLIHVSTSTVTSILGTGLHVCVCNELFLLFTGTAGSADGSSSTATFNGPTGVLLMNGDIYIGDYYNNKIRKISCQPGKDLFC